MKEDTTSEIKKRAISNLAQEIKRKYNLVKTLYINASLSNLFKDIECEADSTIIHAMGRSNEKRKDVIYGDPFEVIDGLKSKFDFITGDLPFGLRKIEWIDKNKKIKIKESWNSLVLFKSLFLLAENGLGLFAVEPAFLWRMTSKPFLEALNQHGFFINAAFNCPDKTFYPETDIRPTLILISRKQTNSLFIAEINEYSKQLDTVIDNLKSNKNSYSLSEGTFINMKDFLGFEKHKISQELEKLSEQYKEFQTYVLKNIAEEINLSARFTKKNNSIYIPTIGHSPIITDLSIAKLKHHNYVQVVIDRKLAHAEYLALFFSSEVGNKILQMLFQGSVIKHLNKKDLEECSVPLPSLEIQEMIISGNKKINTLKNKIIEFEQEIALNPKSVSEIIGELDRTLLTLNKLSDADQVLSLIRQGESKTLEFKQTLSKNIHTNQKDKNIEHSVLKTIAAFLNTDGGILLVGVSDSGKIEGIEKDFFKSEDEYSQHFLNLFRDQIGPVFYPLVDNRVIKIEEKRILFVKCGKSDNPVFLGKGKDEEFYVRANPATDKLVGRELLEYIKTHFKDRQ